MTLFIYIILTLCIVDILVVTHDYKEETIENDTVVLFYCISEHSVIVRTGTTCKFVCLF